MGEVDDGNVVYIDEYNRERWLLKLRVARETGQIAVFNAKQREEHNNLDNLIIFPVERTMGQNTPDGAA